MTDERFERYKSAWPAGITPPANLIFDAGVQSEREECAKAAENEAIQDNGVIPTEEAYNIACVDIAAAIRARGEK